MPKWRVTQRHVTHQINIWIKNARCFCSICYQTKLLSLLALCSSQGLNSLSSDLARVISCEHALLTHCTTCSCLLTYLYLLVPSLVIVQTSYAVWLTKSLIPVRVPSIFRLPVASDLQLYFPLRVTSFYRLPLRDWPLQRCHLFQTARGFWNTISFSVEGDMLI